MKESGTIISFYSFKGGVGRTMSLVNIAILLARKYKVLIIDFDLEAPGLEKFLTNFQIKAGKSKGGLLEILENASNSTSKKTTEYQTYIQTVVGSPLKSLHFLSSGNTENNYSLRVQKFDWTCFFEKRDGTAFFENLRDDLKENYDFILIDSRTGYSDTSGICTYFLPDILVLLFTANQQSVDGTLDVAEKVGNARQKLKVDRMPVTILPIPARIDKTVEYEEVKKWTKVFIEKFSVYYKKWLPKNLMPERILEEITIPYVAYYSFGEKLPVMEDSLTKKESPAYFYSQIAKIFESNFRDVEQVLFQGEGDAKEFNIKLEGILRKYQDQLNSRQQAMIKEVYSNGFVTNKWCRETFLVVKDTVNRDLNLLYDLKLIEQVGKGSATKYIKGEKMEF
jgi:MinD-like ATPase involved in chromosome partitioning or flagellar assembly